MKLNQTMKRIVCLALSLMMVFGVVTPAFASTNDTEEKNKVVAEIVASINTNYANAEDAVKIHLAQSTTPAVATTEQLLAETNGSIEEILPVIDQVVAYANDKLTTGCANSEEALFFYNNVATLQESCQEVNEAAKANLATAQANLAAAQAAYDEAVALSLASKEVIKAELEIAKAAVSEAEAVLEITTNKLLSVENVLAEAAADVNAWKAEAQNALDAAAAHLAESNAQLDATLAALAIENAEFVAAVETFKTQSEVFATSVRTLADSIEDAKTKDAALNALYAEYAAVKAAYEASLADFSAVAGTEVLSYEEANQVKSDLNKAMVDAEDALAKVDARYNEVKAEREALDEFFYQISVMEEYGNEQAKNTVIRNLVGHVIQTKLASGLEVKWNDGTYGKSENGFYVVLDGDKVRDRYGYKVASTGEITIHEMKAPYEVRYDDGRYTLQSDEDGLFIEVDEERLTVTKESVNGTVEYKVVKVEDEVINLAFAQEENDKNPNAVSFTFMGQTFDKLPLIKTEEGYSVGVEISVDILGYHITDINVNAPVICDENNTWKVELPWKECINTKWYHVCPLGCTYTDTQETVEVVPTLTKVTYVTDAYYDFETETVKTEKVVGEYFIDESTDSIAVDDTTIELTIERTLGVVTACSYTASVRYEYDATVEQIGDQYTVFEPADAAVRVEFNGEKYNNVLAYCDAVYTEFARLEVALEEAKAAEIAAENKYNSALAAFEAVEAKYAEFSAKDLGVLAALPKNIEDFVTASNIDSLEDITALVEAIATITSDDNSVDGLKAKVSAFEVVATYVPGLEMIIPDLENMSLIELYNYFKNFGETELGKLLDEGTFQHEYFMAWIDAFVSKVKVVEAAIEVVDEARKTITAGLEIIYTGAELSDVAIQTMIEKIENEALSGAVAALTLTVDMVEVSDEMVNAVYAQVAALRNEVAKAEAELEAATAKLAEIEYQNPGQAELNAAKAGLDAANENYNAVAGKLANVEAYITQAETYKAVAWAQYEELLAFEVPAAGEVDPETGVEVPSEGEVVLPTPGVEYVSYTVVFMSEGVELSVQTVEAGTAAVAPTAPTKAADENYTYTFAGWDVDFTNVTSDLVVTAQFTAEGILPGEGEGPVELPTPGVEYVAYTIKFVSEGVVLSEQIVEAGTAAVAPETVPTKAADDFYTYEFAGWDVDFTNVVSDLTITAQFNALPILPEVNEEGNPVEGPVELPTPSVTHTVTYIVDGEEIVVEVVEGEEPSAPEVPKEIVVDGVAYRFVRWAERYVEETGVTVLEPVYEEVVPAPVEPSAPAKKPVESTPVVYYAPVPAPVVEEVVEVEAEVEEVVENVVTDNEITIEDEVVEIEDEETPLADGVTDIVEEEVPLAANKEEEPEVAPVAAVAGTATVAAAGFVAFLFFRRKKSS